MLFALYSLLITNSITNRFLALESIRSFYYGSQNVERGEFAAFVAPYFTGSDDIHAFLWVPLVRGQQRMRFEQAVRKEGLDNFSIIEYSDKGRLPAAPGRDEYFPVLYGEPEGDNAPILGYDLASDPALLSAMDKSRRTGQIIASERVRIPGYPETQYGVYIFVPVYEGNAATQADTDSHRLRGFVTGILHVDGLVQAALGDADIKPVSIHIYDDDAPASKKALCSHCSLPHDQPDMPLRGSVYDKTDDLQYRSRYLIGQRNWTISFGPCQDFFSSYRTSQSLFVLVAGLLITVLTALCFLQGIGRTLQIEHLVDERTRQLRDANSSLEARVAESKRIQAQKEKLLGLLSAANDQLIEYNEKLSRSNRELEDFAYVASHDLQEPLRKVTAFGDRLKAKYSEVLDETGRDYVERMQNAAGRMSVLINDLLTYSRVTTKTQPLAEVDLEKTTREVLEDLQVRIEELDATVDVGPLPCVRGDALQMRQLMQNLISNSLKFRKPDTPPVIRIYSRPADEDATDAAGGDTAVEVVVEDNGIGFDEKYADQIFGMFQRLHGRGEYEGTGIGLAVCRKIAERHGVVLKAKSTAGGGSQFAIRFSCDSVLSQSSVTN